MGLSYKGGASSYHSLGDNLSSVKSDYKLSKGGYFGTKGKSSDNSVRNIKSEDPKATAKDFYDKITYGGIEKPIIDKKTGDTIGKTTTLKDGSVVSWREVSSSDGSPAVEINIKKSSDSTGVKGQKIHFVKGD